VRFHWVKAHVRGRAGVIEVVPCYRIEAACYPEWSACQPEDLERLFPQATRLEFVDHRLLPAGRLRPFVRGHVLHNLGRLTPPFPVT
jgi:hypothetical protein